MIVHVVGTRPNLMKLAPVYKALKAKGFDQKIVHTGQHYDPKMTNIFFDDLGIPVPDINFQVGSGSHAWQTAQIMMKFEEYILQNRPDWVFVYGDVNSTMAAAIVSVKLNIKVAHVEAGIRSYDREMPEEINRLLTDSIVDLLFTPTREAGENLLKENVASEKIVFIGNVMIDTLKTQLPEIEKIKLDFDFEGFILVTLHRPSNVDDLNNLGVLMKEINKIAEKIHVVFPCHPRTLSKINQLDFPLHPNVKIIEPVGYNEIISMQMNSTCVVTDSGGIQEETTILGVPCLTLRKNTERPITITEGTNTLIGDDFVLLNQKIDEILEGKYKLGKIPEYWDGFASDRIADYMISISK